MSPVSSVLSWFFSSLGWNVPIPRRSFSLSTRRCTFTCSIVFRQSPPYRSIRSAWILRQNGQTSPYRRIFRPSGSFSLMAASTSLRASIGISSSGSSCIGQASTTSASPVSSVPFPPARCGGSFQLYVNVLPASLRL